MTPQEVQKALTPFGLSLDAFEKWMRGTIVKLDDYGNKQYKKGSVLAFIKWSATGKRMIID